MAKISLRAYLREIETLINQGRNDEAIAHLRQILQRYPKHVESYKLLGKCYLETERHTDAIDVFQRLLAAVPDDFVAHLGMSIIREGENNLDAAIWHMERAYEIQPFNNAIQEELKRLYEQRDGVAPLKVRLSRAALARMYAKGDLYQQAIAELRAELAKDAGRTDLQVLLARMYARSGKRVEAAQGAGELLSKLPYCLEANRILCESLQDTERASEIESYRHRLVAMDPYEEFVSEDLPTIDRVPDDAITIDRLDMQPAEIAARGRERSDWMASLGIEASAFENVDEDLPDWLIAASKGSEPAPGAALELEEPVSRISTNTDWAAGISDETLIGQPAAPDEADIPDWMKSAGWAPGTEAGRESEKLPLDTSEDNLAAGDLPEWLRNMAPETMLPGSAEEETSEDTDLAALLGGAAGGAVVAGSATPATGGLPDWLRGLEDQEESVSEAGVAAPKFTAETPPAPSWLDEPEPVETEQPPVPPVSQVGGQTIGLAPAESDDDLPEWLRGLAEPELPIESQPIPAAQTSIAPAPVSSAEEDEELPGWLKQIDMEDTESEAAPAGTVLFEADAEAEQPAAEDSQSADLSSWLQGLDQESAEAETTDASADIFAELTYDTAESEVDADADLTAEDLIADESEANFDFAALHTGSETAFLGEVESEAVETEAEVSGELPDWFSEFAASEAAAPGETAMLDEGLLQAEPGEVPDWLAALRPGEAGVDLQSEAEALDVELQADVTPVAAGEAPAPVLEEPSSEISETATFGMLDETQTKPSEVELESPPDFADMDAALAWLQGLADKHGEVAEELSTEAVVEPASPADQTELEIAASQSVETQEVDEEELPLLPEPDEAIFEPFDAAAESAEAVAQAEEPVAAPEGGIELESPPDFANLDDAMAWLERLGSQGSAATDLIGAAEAETPTAEPDELEAPVTTAVEAAAEIEIAETAEAVDEIEDVEAVLPSPEAETAVPAAALLEEPELPAAEETTPSESTEAEALSTEVAFDGVELESPPDFADMDAALAWLEGLASRQGAPEAELSTPPTERPSAPPEWVVETAETTLEPLPAETTVEPTLADSLAAAEAELDELAQPAELPDWLKDLALEDAQELAPEVEAADDWFIETGAPEAAPEDEDETSAEIGERTPLPPDWVLEADREAPSVSAAPAQPTQAEPIQAEPAAEDEGEFAWTVPAVIDETRLSIEDETPGAPPEVEPGLEPESALPAGTPEQPEEAAAEPLPAAPLEVEIPGKPSAALAEARRQIEAGNLAGALPHYERLIQSSSLLYEVIFDLKAALQATPRDFNLWQILGDAYMRDDQLTEALEAYNHAEDLL